MKKIEELEILEGAIGLEVGQTSRSIECPFCPAHDKEKNSLAVTRNEYGVLYTCYRAKCAAKGFIPTLITGSKVKKKQKVHKLTRPLAKLSDAEQDYIANRFGVPFSEQYVQGFKYLPQDNRFYMPVYTYEGWEIGGVARAFDGNAKKKVISYFNDEDSVRLHFPIGIEKHKNQERVIIVEDILSAVRVNRYVPCVALLGTSFGEDKVSEILRHWDRAIIALDPDTWYTKRPIAVDYYNKYSLYFEELVPIFIYKDFKNMSENELIIALKEILYVK